MRRRLAQAAYVLRLAAWRHPGRRLLVGAGVAAGAAVLGASVAGSLVAADAKLERTLRSLPATERSVHVAHFGIARDRAEYGDLDRAVERAIDPLELGPPIRVLQYKEAHLGRGLGLLAALDEAERWVRLRSGRLPRPCTPARCEVLRLGGRGPTPVGEGFPLVVVGEATLASARPFGRLLGLSGGDVGDALDREDSLPFLLADGVEAAAAIPRLATTYRTYAWVYPLEDVHPWGADAFRARLDDAQATLQTRSFAFEVAAPTSAIETATAEARVAGRRLLIVGGQAAALVLAFTILAAEALRRDFLAVRRRLTWFGARRRQIAAVAVVDFGALAVAATAVGWLAAGVASAVIARLADVSAGDVIRHSLVSPAGLAAALAVATVTTVALVAIVHAARAPSGRRISAIDLTVGGVLAGLLLALSRGAADPEALANERGSVALVLLLPALALFVAAALCGRILAPALRALSRPAARLPSLRLRLPLLALARNPGRAAVAAAFLVVSVGGALFALAYRATLDRGIDDRVDYAFPLDFVVRENLSEELARPLEVAPLSRYRGLGDGVEVVPAIRRHASVPRLGGAESLTLLALPADRLGSLSGWRADFSALSRAEIVRRLAPQKQVALRGARLPRDAAALRVRADVTGEDVGLRANILNVRGDFTTVELAPAEAGANIRTAALPAQARGGLVVALTLTRPFEVEAHAKGSVPIVEGTVALGPLTARAGGRWRTLGSYSDWRGDGDVSLAGRAGGSARLRYAVTNDIGSRFRPRQPLDGAAVPVLASPAVAAAASDLGLVRLRVPGGELSARVVGTARYFPTLSGDFVVADERMLRSALNTDRPGAAVTSEIWIGAPPGQGPRLERALRAEPFSALALGTRSQLEEALSGDPLARGTELALTATAVVALGLALLGLLLLVRGDLGDERGDLFDLEAQGADPRLLELHLRGRAALVAAAGTAAGVASGVALTGLVVSVVTVTAGGSAGRPPLDLVLDWRRAVLAVALFAAVAGALVALSTRRAFADAVPKRTAD